MSPIHEAPILGGHWDEIPEKPEVIAQSMESRQLAWLHLEGWNPTGKEYSVLGMPDDQSGCVLEFVDGMKVMLCAAPIEPTNDLPFRTIWVWRVLETPKVLNSWELHKHLRGFTATDRYPRVSPIQQEVHGLFVHHVRIQAMPNQQMGQDITIELSGGVKLHLKARRRAQKIDPNNGSFAAFELGLSKPRIILTGGGE